VPLPSDDPQASGVSANTSPNGDRRASTSSGEALSGHSPGGPAAAGAASPAAAGGGSSASRAATVATGILSSRVVGFLRERAIAYFFGVGAHADVFRVALRGPNILQNLLGEGTISAAFIPIYSRMLADAREEDAGRFAGAIFGLLLALVAGLTLLGVLFAGPIVTVLAPGFLADAGAAEGTVDRFALAVACVRIIFPMTGILVLSAWALGVLNSHRRFFVPYFAPVLWNVAIIAALFGAAAFWMERPLAGEAVEAMSTALEDRLVVAACWGALAGGLLQFLVQLPQVVRVLRGFRLSLSLEVEGVRESIGAFGPVVAGRGVGQLSTYLDLFLASFLAAGALGALGYASQIYLLPVSLFGLSVAAAELPELSRVGAAERAAFLDRVHRSLGQVAFLVVPTFVGYLAFGYPIVGLLFQTGDFGPADTWLIYFVLCAYTLALPTSTASRLLQNSFYALGDTKTPAKVAVLRVVVAAAVAVPVMFLLDRVGVAELVDAPPTDEPLRLGAVGLALGTAVASWFELWRLRTILGRRVEGFGLPLGRAVRMAGLAAAAAVPAAGTWTVLPGWHVALDAAVVVTVYAVVYLAGAYLLKLPELDAWAGRFLRRLGR